MHAPDIVLLKQTIVCPECAREITEICKDCDLQGAEVCRECCDRLSLEAEEAALDREYDEKLALGYYG